MSSTEKRTYQQILEEIEVLQEKAEAIRQAEVAAVIEDVRAKIKAYNLTARDLGLTTESSTARSQRGAAPSSPMPPKYRDPVSGKTWTGRGVHPGWLKEYVAQGRNKEEFAIAK